MDLLRPNNCTVCGANLNMVGRSHRCIPKPATPAERPRRTRSGVARALAPGQSGGGGETQLAQFDRKTYQRNYMRDYMRTRRGSKLNVPKSS